ncbi:copper amine oxidase N-terminal domain-containing protein [Ruminiclostridium papyrosolvens]|uniref:Copper amine oxidase n=1 Tax=Ruminiclostridium papyrosolvens C7 TaxID=1330534 RepID=U4R163_9FIRM|nr:copper amine oxidase N-terminal domain-containing protein [Ruminiclostridium papyrosolvens]EPR10400.1 copper amine oxidase [Ruminiclostridium papyrosolvens C7]
MKNKRIVAGLLAVTILSLSSVPSLANYTENLKAVNISEQIDSTENQSSFSSFTGKVKEITDFKGVEGSKFVLVENQDGQQANLIISNSTYVVNNEKIDTGSVITGFYDANAPMLMIYPPQYNIEVVNVASSKVQCIKIDRFGKDLISSDNMLKLNISKETEIISQDGKAFEGELANRNLVVLYGISTRSIPAQTNPDKIVVLFEKAVEPTDEEKAILSGNVTSMDIVVNSKAIEAPSAYTNKKGTFMVPLRAIAENLGFNVNWEGKTKTVMLGKDISLTIGKDIYIFMKTTPLQLGTAPEIVDGKTFVPLSFFKDVLGMKTVNVSGSDIVISD